MRALLPLVMAVALASGARADDLRFDTRITTIATNERPFAKPYASAVMDAADQVLWHVLVLPYSAHCGAPFGPCFYAAPLNVAMTVVDLFIYGPSRIVHP